MIENYKDKLRGIAQGFQVIQLGQALHLAQDRLKLLILLIHLQEIKQTHKYRDFIDKEHDLITEHVVFQTIQALIGKYINFLVFLNLIELVLKKMY